MKKAEMNRNAALDNKTGVQQSLLDSLNYLTHKYCVNG